VVGYATTTEHWEIGMKYLSEPEQALWRRLSVFAGSFSRESIEAVSLGEDIPQETAANLLDQLVAQGVVTVEAQGQESRYRLPEALRATAQTQLVDSGEEGAVYNRLVAFLSRLAEQALQEAFGLQRVAWMQRLEDEHINLCAALSWLVAQGDAESGLHLAFLLQELWFEEAHTSEGRSWFAALLALPQAAARTAQRAQALDLAGALALNQSDYAAARALQEEGVAILRELGNQERLGYSLLHLGHLTGYAQEDFPTAQALYQEGLDLFQGLSHTEGTAHALANLGNIAILTGDYAAAWPLIADSLRMYRELGDAYRQAWSLGSAAGIAAGSGQSERALRLAGASAMHCAEIGVSQPAIYATRTERMIERARLALSEATQAALWAEGQVMPLDQAVAYALEEPIPPDSGA
jgi:tetratricopeptide (TPR) repeat protein